MWRIWSIKNTHKSYRLLWPSTNFLCLEFSILKIWHVIWIYDFCQSIRKCNIIIHRASHHPLKSQMAIHDSIPIIKECNHKSFPLTEDRILFLQE